MKYNLVEPWKTLDPWQQKLLKTKGHAALRCGRQTGKSTAVSILAANTALQKPNEYILIGARDLDQAEMIFWKIKEYIWQKHPNKLVGRATLHFLQLKNGSKIICKAIGDTGEGMRGPTATMIIIDEAAFVPDRAWVAIEPVISVTKGRIILLSTPQGKKGFFYKAFQNKEYTQFHITARECPRHSKKFLDQKEAELSPVAFATEYLGEFIDDYNRKFIDEWIEKVCVLEKEKVSMLVNSRYVMGIDVAAGVGKGETTFEGFDATDKKNVFQVYNIYSNTISGPDIERQIEQLINQNWNYGRKSIGFDSRGVGSGSYQYMLENTKLKNLVVALDNATRPIDNEGKTTRLLKEYMYDVVEEMGWRGELKCFNEGSIKQSFESIQVEFKSNGERGYSGSYDHIVEGIIRAVWMAKNKGLNIMSFCK
jgi:hypothetical protein